MRLEEGDGAVVPSLMGIATVDVIRKAVMRGREKNMMKREEVNWMSAEELCPLLTSLFMRFRIRLSVEVSLCSGLACPSCA